jgi:hypothetical protein
MRPYKASFIASFIGPHGKLIYKVGLLSNPFFMAFVNDSECMRSCPPYAPCGRAPTRLTGYGYGYIITV